MLCVGLADKYGEPPSEFMERWTSHDVAMLTCYAQIRNEAEAEPEPPQYQDPDEIIDFLDSIGNC